jgi:hypothetical protein
MSLRFTLPAGRPAVVWLQLIYTALAAILGLALGTALGSSKADMIASAVLLSAFTLVTFRYPLEGLLLSLILQPFVGYLFLEVDLGSGFPDITLGRWLVPLMFAIVLAQGVIGRRRLPRVTWLDAVMAMCSLMVVVMVLRGRAVTTGLQWALDMFLIAFALYYLAKNLAVDEAAVRKVLWATAVIGAYNGLYGIYTQTTGHVLFSPEGSLANSARWYTENLRLMRGLLDSPHIFGTVFVIAIPIQFYLLIRSRTIAARLLAGLFLGLTVGGLYFTYHRTSYLAFAVGLLVLQYFFPRFRRFFLPIIALLGFVVWLYSGEISRSTVVQERAGQRVETLNGRLALWTTALSYASREPIWGYGYNSLGRIIRLPAIESHYLWLLTDGGLLTLTPFILIFVGLAMNGWRLFRSRAPDVYVEPDLVGAFLGSLGAYLVCLSTAVINHDFPHQLMFLLAGAVLGSQEAHLARRSDVEISLPASEFSSQSR